jgi:hypothetical protein
MIKRIIAMCLELVFLCFMIVFPVFCQSDKISIPDIEIKKAEQSFVEEKYGMAIFILRNLEQFLRRPEFVNNNNECLIKTEFLLGACYLKLGRNNVTDILFREVLKISPKYEVDKSAYGEDVVQLFEKLKEDIAEAEKASSSVQTPIMNRGSVETDKSTQTSGIQVRVIKEGSVLKLKPDDESLTIKKLPLGSLLDVKAIMEEWVKVKLPPNQDGIVVVGYIRVEDVEMESQLDK